MSKSKVVQFSEVTPQRLKASIYFHYLFFSRPNCCNLLDRIFFLVINKNHEISRCLIIINHHKN